MNFGPFSCSFCHHANQRPLRAFLSVPWRFLSDYDAGLHGNSFVFKNGLELDHCTPNHILQSVKKSTEAYQMWRTWYMTVNVGRHYTLKASLQSLILRSLQTGSIGVPFRQLSDVVYLADPCNRLHLSHELSCFGVRSRSVGYPLSLLSGPIYTTSHLFTIPRHCILRTSRLLAWPSFDFCHCCRRLSSLHTPWPVVCCCGSYCDRAFSIWVQLAPFFLDTAWRSSCSESIVTKIHAFITCEPPLKRLLPNSSRGDKV